MQIKLLYILFFLLLLGQGHLFAQRKNKVPFAMDSLHMAPVDQREHILYDNPDADLRDQEWYDSLKVRSQKRAFPRLLHNVLIIKHKRDTTTGGRFINENNLLKQYNGKTIGNIAINRREIFDEDGNWLERTGNKLHVLTRRKVITRDLLIHPGDVFNSNLVVKNSQMIRDRDYISNVTIDVLPREGDTTIVDLAINTLDRWTISGDLRFKSEGETMVEFYDANFLGFGNRLSLQTYFDWKEKSYLGNIVGFSMPNIYGSFIGADFLAGRGYKESIKSAALSKEFIRRSDYMFGASYTDHKDSDYYLAYCDSMDLVASRKIDGWLGYSIYIPAFRASMYLMGRYAHSDFYERPPTTTADFNPSFHDNDMAFASFGFYKERFYTATMIYGFGFREYLASGFLTEVVGGYSWGEFYNNYYLGGTFKIGGFNRLGYITAGATVGSYRDMHNGTWWRSAIDVDIRWFSNLFVVGKRSRLRQFGTIFYTQGWNRGDGADEVLQFTKYSGPRSFSDKEVTGRTRLVLNTESVLFTPVQKLGFRMAFFGFADFGFLGNKVSPFRNDFYTTLGVGVRLRNERLVFKTLQLRFAVAFGKNGFISNRYFDLTNQQHLERYRFIPTRPDIVGYQ